jgi:PAS domain S-box-containing protein
VATASVDTRELLRVAVRETQTLARASGAAIGLCEGEEVTVAAASGFVASSADVRLPANRSLSGYVSHSGQPVLCADTWIDPRADQELCRRLHVRSAVVMPLQYDSHTVGVLNVVSPEPNAFDEAQVEIVQLMAILVGTAIGQAQAMSERARAEEGARQSAERFAAILRAASEVAILGVDLTGKVIFFNHGAERMLGYTAEEALGLSPTAFHDPVELEKRTTAQGVSEVDAFIGPALRGAAGTAEWTYVRKDGARLLVSLSVTGMRAPDGALVGFVGVAVDITERSALDRMKDELISIVSHEVRTPLTAIRAALGLLSAGMLGSLTNRGERMVQVAVNNTDRLVEVLNNILDLERIRASAMRLYRQPVDIGQLMFRARDNVEAIADRAGARVEVVPLSTTLNVDPDRMLQVFTQLLNNAIKFSGSPCTVCLRPRESDTSDVVRIEVVDQGSGIPREHLERIFEPFHQVDASDSRAKGGGGLGLAICRYVVELHGGRIWAESRLGSGSTFVVELPR